VDTKTKKIIDDWKFLLRRQEIEGIRDWWNSITVDEKFFSSSDIVFDMPKDYRKRLVRVFIEAEVPRLFFDGLKKISCYRHTWKNADGHDSLGFYSPRDATIYIHPTEFSSFGGLRSTGCHELAHHIQMVLGYETDFDLPQKWREIDRRHPGRFENSKEFFANVFKAAFEDGFSKEFWKKYTGINKLHPSMFRKKHK
jgi:hypothetical protein